MDDVFVLNVLIIYVDFMMLDELFFVLGRSDLFKFYFKRVNGVGWYV